MSRRAAEIEAAVRAAGLLARDRPVLVLFSGGRDSTCLLDLARRIGGPGAVRALHVNYGLREGAVLDERHCAQLCEGLGVSLTVERPPGPVRRGNLQAWARDVRYDAAAARAGPDDIAAGHTVSDQLETILYRLISSPSRRALLGMDGRSGQLIRPLLSVTRAETAAYCSERELPFRDDPTNDSSAYVRNRIRNELVPLLTELHPGAVGNVLALAGTLRAESAVLEGDVSRVLAGRSAVPLSELRALPRGLSHLVVQELADVAVHGPAAGVARRADDILAMGADGKLDLPGRVRATTHAGVLHFELTPPLSR